MENTLKKLWQSFNSYRNYCQSQYIKAPEQTFSDFMEFVAYEYQEDKVYEY